MRALSFVSVVLAAIVPALASAQEPSGLARASDVVETRSESAQPAPNEPVTVPILERLGVTGSLRAGYWSSTRNLDQEQPLGAGMVWLKTSRRLSGRFSFLAEGWVSARGPWNRGDAAGDLREAFVDLRFGGLDVRAGRQIIAWGRADGINPTDNLSGQDLTLLVPDDADRRLGTTAARVSYYAGDVSLTGVWLPEFRGHRFALPEPPPGVAFANDDDRWPGDQWAARVEQTGRAVDWSVSYFDGKDMAPDLAAASGTEPRPQPGFFISHHRVRVVGADMAANLGRFGLRAEGAYVSTEDANGKDPFIKNPFLFIVAGADRTWGGLLNLNVQYLFRSVMEHADSHPGEGVGSFESMVASTQAVVNSQATRAQHGASFRIAYRWFHETVEGELAAAGYGEPRGVSVRPKLTYAVTDNWKVLAGAEIFRGDATSLFGLMRSNSGGYVEVRRSF